MERSEQPKIELNEISKRSLETMISLMELSGEELREGWNKFSQTNIGEKKEKSDEEIKEAIQRKIDSLMDTKK